MKKITILGSTGSIGRSALDVISENRELFRVAALTAGKNIELFEKQIRTFSPEIVAVADKKTADKLKSRVGRMRVLYGPEGISEVAAYPESDYVISSIVGAAGLLPTIAAVRAGKTVGLANKESLVMAGDIVMADARRNRVKIIPVDSEHSAVFQCIDKARKKDVRRIILTASGGPFHSVKKDKLAGIKAEDALKHPNWSMGRKISIDSATLMNKGLEVIEACMLFGMPAEKVDVLIHPQSIVHSMVEFRDRGLLAQLSVPDMKGPIAYALAYPERLDNPIAPLELDAIGTLTFKKPDHDKFPCLSYAYDALRAGGTMPSALNAANEAAVEAFLGGRISFNDIPAVISGVLESHSIMPSDDLDSIMEADSWARKKSGLLIRRLSAC